MIRFPPKKILVPFDMSDLSLLAWRHAAAMARRFSATVEVLYVQEWIPTLEILPPAKLTPAKKRALTAEIRGKLGAQPRISILEGDPSVNILRLARKRGHDLIVMGSRGRTGLERAWMGSVAEVVTRLSTVPVYVARGPAKTIRSVVAPVNFTNYSDYGFIFAAGVAAAYKARLTAVHVASDPLRSGNSRFRLSTAISRLPAEVLKTCRPQVDTIKGKIPGAILGLGKRHGLIVLTSHKKSLIKDALLGTTAERVLRASSVPVLTVPEPKGAFSLSRWGVRTSTRKPA